MERLAADPQFQVYRTPTMRVLWIGMNTQHPKLTRDVRLALAHGIDKETDDDVCG